MDKKILVVDDSDTIRHLVRTALQGEGFHITEACDGVEGLELLSADDDIRAVLLDVNMPRMGGLQMLELVKSRGKIPALPVVMLTTEGQPALVQQAKALGARGWIVKPFKPEHLVAALRKLTT